jgi:hypothetical protein
MYRQASMKYTNSHIDRDEDEAQAERHKDRQKYIGQKRIGAQPLRYTDRRSGEAQAGRHTDRQ